MKELEQQLRKKYENRANKKCPACSNRLRIVLHGLVCDDVLQCLKKIDIPFYNAGCMCYGDDRDEQYFCSSCRRKYDDKLKEIVLTSCPRVCDYMIHQEDCGDETLLHKKYIVNKDKGYCEACKILKESNEEEAYKKAATLVGISEDLIEKVIQKKNKNLIQKCNLKFIDYLCDEEDILNRIKHW